ncbi:ABC transporter permease [Gorillibacterium sp. CAU 1737]|uniref:ABC transporter permease n=1 Tax=Gorillibacterium sp. CAU 1737 TaxID=3140362 RepID=UPI0032607822
MAPLSYFLSRVRSNWAFQWRVLRLIVDWIVAVYVVLPGLAILGYFYVTWWVTPPEWFSFLTFGVIRSGLFLFMLNGTVRYFLVEADQLHFEQGERWADRFRRYGAVYSAVVGGGVIAFLAALLTPVLLLNGRLNLPEFLLLFLYVWLYQMGIHLILQFADIRLAGWRLYLAKAFLVMGLALVFAGTTRLFLKGALLGLLCCVVALVVVWALFRRRFRAKAALLSDVRRDSAQKYKYVAFILRDQVAKKPTFPRRKPLLFRKSQRIFKKRTASNVLAESGLKSLVRSTQQMKSYAMITGVFVFGSLVTRIGSQDQLLFSIIWIISGFILSYFVRLQWGEFQNNAFLGLFSWEPGSWYNALRAYVFLAMLPGFLVISAAIWLPALPPLKAVLFLPIAVGVAYSISGVYSTFAALKLDRQTANR